MRFADTPEELIAAAEAVLGLEIRGHTVRQVMAVEKVAIERELYLSILLDRDAKRHVLLFSPRGGVDIEQTARVHPEQVCQAPDRPAARPVAGCRCVSGRQGGVYQRADKALGDLLTKLYACVRKNDCLLAEINPLAVQPDGDLSRWMQR